MPIPKKPLADQPKTARDRVYVEVRKWIVEGILRPGEKISDQEISKYFSVSRTPVREAMRMLAEQKLIEVVPGKLSRVTEIDPQRTKSAYRIAAELHVLALDEAFPKMDEAFLTRLTEANENFHKACLSGNIVWINEADHVFHKLIVDQSGDDFLMEFTETLNGHIQRLENIYFKDSRNGEESYLVHREMIAALAEGDLEGAKEQMRENWLGVNQMLEKED